MSSVNLIEKKLKMSSSSVKTNQLEGKTMESDNKQVDAFEIVKRVHPLYFFKNEYIDGVLDKDAVKFNSEFITKCKRHLFILSASRLLLNNQTFSQNLHLTGSKEEQRQIQLSWSELIKANENFKLDPIDSLFVNTQQQSTNLLKIITRTVEFLQKIDQLILTSQNFVDQMSGTTIELRESLNKIERHGIFKMAMDTLNELLNQIVDLNNIIVPTVEDLKTALNQTTVALNDVEIRQNMLCVQPKENYIYKMLEEIHKNESGLNQCEESRKNYLQSFTSENIRNIMTKLYKSSDQNENILSEDIHIEQLVESQRINLSQLTLNPTSKTNENDGHHLQRNQTDQNKSPVACSSLNNKRRLTAKPRGNDGLGQGKRVKRIHKKIKCSYCGKLFYDEATMQKHVKSIHSKNSGLSCTRCGKKFQKYDYLIKHYTFFCPISTAINNTPL